jgi:hypothetical protein
MYLFKLKEYDQLVPQLEKIKEKFLEEGEREVIYEEMKKMDEVERSIKVTTIFCDNYRFFSIFYFLVNFTIAFCLIGILLVGVNFTYDNYYNRFRTFKEQLYFLLIGVFGTFLGWFLVNFTIVKRKIYIICHFGLLVIFSTLSVFYNSNTHFFGGVFLFFSLSLLTIFVKFGWEIYSEPLHHKVKTLFSFSLFFSAFITVLIVNPLYFYRLNAALISLITMSFAGFVLSFFLDKDIN